MIRPLQLVLDQYRRASVLAQYVRTERSYGFLLCLEFEIDTETIAQDDTLFFRTPAMT